MAQVLMEQLVTVTQAFLIAAPDFGFTRQREIVLCIPHSRENKSIPEWRLSRAAFSRLAYA